MANKIKFRSEYSEILAKHKILVEEAFLTKKNEFKEILKINCMHFAKNIEKTVSSPIYLFHMTKNPIFYIIYQDLRELIEETKKILNNLEEKKKIKKILELEALQKKKTLVLYIDEDKIGILGGFKMNQDMFLFSKSVRKIMVEGITIDCKYYLNNEELDEIFVYSNLYYAINHPWYFLNFQKEFNTF